MMFVLNSSSCFQIFKLVPVLCTLCIYTTNYYVQFIFNYKQVCFELDHLCVGYMSERLYFSRIAEVKKGIPKILHNSQETLLLESLFNNVSCLKACNFIKKRFQQMCFLRKFATFLSTLFLMNTSGKLLV